MSTYDVLSSKIESIHHSYGLNGKLAVTVIDNGSNFVKTFSVTDSTSAEVVQEEYCPEEDCIDEEEAIFENVHDTLTLDNVDDLTQVEHDLPTHERCAVHTMNLVASTDITKSLSTSSLSKTEYRNSFAKSSSTDTVEVEAANYLSIAKELNCLHKYPIIKSLLLKYTTTLPSSTLVERLFSLGNLVLTPRQNRLNDARFEKLLLMRFNKHF